MALLVSRLHIVAVYSEDRTKPRHTICKHPESFNFKVVGTYCTVVF
jgi:hypothetical protein